MGKDFFQFISYDNIGWFLAYVILITAIYLKILPLGEKKSKQKFLAEIALQTTFGVITAFLLASFNLITPPWAYYSKKLLLDGGCYDLPGCKEEHGIYFIANVTIQYSSEPDYFKISYVNQNKTSGKSKEIKTLINQKRVLGWE